MREIKFRAWDGENMGAPFYPLSNQYLEEEGRWTGISIFMQYTGLKDKNGKEIYEGDIARSSDTNGVFKFEGGLFYASPQIEEEDCVIIGNIYENPELTK